MLKQILTDIQTQLIANVPELRYMDEDWGQLEYEQPPVQYPCALIDVDGFDYSQTGDLGQLADGAVYVRIADIRRGNTSGNAPDNQKQAAFALFDVLEAVSKALHGYTGGDYSKLLRVSMKRIRRNDTTREYRFTFKTSYQAHSEAKASVPAPKPIVKLQKA